MTRLLLTTAMACTLMVSIAHAAGLKQGDAVGAFYVTKVAGAVGDGVEEGQELCYRCRYGSRPMVMVFARETGGRLPELVQKIEAAVKANGESQLKGLITFMGDDVAKLKTDATKFADKTKAEQIPLVIAKETKTGPVNYKLDDSPVTIVIAKDSQVVATHRFEADKIDVTTVMKEVKRVLE